MIDATRPTSARIENRLIGGSDHYPADRRAADALLRVDLAADERVIAAHEFVRGAVRQLARDGAHQLLDLRCPLPSWRPYWWHPFLMQRQPLARIVYCAHDPMVFAHAQMMLVEAPGVRVIDADPGTPGLLAHPVVQSHLNLVDEPVVVIASGLLDHLTDTAVTRLLDELPVLAPGSVLVLATSVCRDAGRADRIARTMDHAAPGVWPRLRTPEAVKSLHPALSSGLSCTDTDEPQLATALLDLAAPAVPSETSGADGEPAD
ncbi:SAM-dependent methyltransferase [Streptomyces sp. NRRL F-525]|uniref:SAM-dependent methyltransferase n=1 Tax=Streptomyces sp. NRRL F-525 TaxID=1463861 RepID=UPI000525C57F|nr:SAM-dependent methyltransferase [Streptomyces sp. NRRL F-525]